MARFAGSAAAPSAYLLTLSIIIVVAALSISPSAAFTSSSSCRRCVVKTNARASSISVATAALPKLDQDTTSAIENAKQQINQAISTTDKGRSSNLSSTQRSQIASQLAHLESLCPISEPARNPLMEGPWIVLYTDAPSPSNGQLGPFKGVAKQVIYLQKGTYKNELYVGGSGTDEDENAWLGAVLEATWKEWDGVYLDNDKDDAFLTTAAAATTSSGSSNSNNNIDHGATTWRVDFLSLTLSIFKLPIFTQKFKEGTARTWKMTYLDGDTRIVRAGKTGRGEDDWIFYMRRGVSE